MSLVGGLRRYLLRVYAAQARKQNASDALGPFGEAVFQTVVLVWLIVFGLSGALALLIFFPLFEQVLLAHRGGFSIGFAVVSWATAYLVARSIAGNAATLPALAEKYATQRDRRMIHIQFWCVLITSLALPFLALGVRTLVDR